MYNSCSNELRHRRRYNTTNVFSGRPIWKENDRRRVKKKKMKEREIDEKRRRRRRRGRHGGLIARGARTGRNGCGNRTGPNAYDGYCLACREPVTFRTAAVRVFTTFVRRCVGWAARAERSATSTGRSSCETGYDGQTSGYQRVDDAMTSTSPPPRRLRRRTDGTNAAAAVVHSAATWCLRRRWRSGGLARVRHNNNNNIRIRIFILLRSLFIFFNHSSILKLQHFERG